MKGNKLLLITILFFSVTFAIYAQEKESDFNNDTEEFESDSVISDDENSNVEESDLRSDKYGEDLENNDKNNEVQQKGNDANKKEIKDVKDYNSISLGLMNGGSLIGIEYERLLFNRFGVTAGCGLLGFNGGINFHLKEDINSHYIHLGTVNMGTLDYYFRYAELSANFRVFKLVELSIGFGYTLGLSDSYSENYNDNFDTDPPDYFLTYSIGLYTTF